MPVTSRQRRPAPEVERMYSPREVQSLLGIGRTRVYELIRSGALAPSYRLSYRCVRVPASAVARYLESRQV